MELGLSTGFLHVESVEETIALCREAGIHSLELWEQDGFFSSAVNPEEIRDLLHKQQIQVRSLHTPFTRGALCTQTVRDGYLEEFDHCCRKGRLYGASYVVFHPLVMEGEAPESGRFAETAPDSLSLWKEIAQLAKGQGLKVAFENIPAGRGWPQGCTWTTACAITSALAESNTGTCLDISHVFANDESGDILFDLMKKTPPMGIHLSDGIKGTKQDRHFPPGEGDFEWQRFFRVLKNLSYSGQLVLEVNSPYLSGHLLKGIVRFLNEKMKEEAADFR
jgi:sugar phosphate isomerase/epimerase